MKNFARCTWCRKTNRLRVIISSLDAKLERVSKLSTLKYAKLHQNRKMNLKNSLLKWENFTPRFQKISKYKTIPINIVNFKWSMNSRHFLPL